MKKIIYLLLFIILISCSKNTEVEEENIPIMLWNTIENDIEAEKIDQIENFLKDKQNIEPITRIWTQNNVQKNELPIKIKNKNPITTPINKTSEYWVLTKEELNIIENTTDWEIDKLIDILFKDLN